MKAFLQSRKQFLIKAAAVFVVILLGYQVSMSTFKLGIDPQVIRCLDFQFYLIKLWEKDVERGEINAFASKALPPYFAEGQSMAKVIAGMPGDHLVQNEEGVFINGELILEGYPVADVLEKDPSAFFKDEIIPEGMYFGMGTNPQSYDSRYWGYIAEDQIMGGVIPIY